MQKGELIAITGATGFIGSRLVEVLRERSIEARALSRRASSEGFRHGDIGPNTDWREALRDVTVVIHCAARVHVMRDTVDFPLTAFREVNVEGTRRLAEAAVDAGVTRLVYVSSIKVNGELAGVNTGRSPFRHDDIAAPTDDYGRSKLEAERALGEIEASSSLEVVIVRPPLVYGKGARGNFPRLVRLVKSGVPLPLASIRNKRSLVSLDNLIDLLICCATHGDAPGNTFLVSDGIDLSTPQLVEKIAQALGTKARLWPVPSALLQAAGSVLGKSAEMQRLTESLQVQIEQTQQILGWEPPVGVEEAMKRAVADA
jgi:nucleoside-diphosphate-sugar epimerase